VHDEIVRRHTASGTAAAARARLAAYREIGLDEVILAGLTEPQTFATLWSGCNDAPRNEPLTAGLRP
jgi:hypothetical protein